MKVKLNVREFIKEHANHCDLLQMHGSVAIDKLIDAKNIPEEFEFDIDIHELLSQNRQIAHIWGVEDVLEVRPDLGEEQAWEVLKECDRQLDSLHGLCWDDIKRVATDLFGMRGERLAKCSRSLAEYGDDLPEANLIDLLTDAMLWCDSNGHEFQRLLETASKHFSEETNSK